MEQNEIKKSNRYDIKIPERTLSIMLYSTCFGFCIGTYRGGRLASRKFLAENTHRRPTTVQGWYFYNKTKNYKVIKSSLIQGLKDCFKINSLALTWVFTSELIKYSRENVFKEFDNKNLKIFDEVVGATSTSILFSILCE